MQHFEQKDLNLTRCQYFPSSGLHFLSSRLKPETLDAILRIRINGPEIEEFDAIRYARLWAKEGRMLPVAPASSADKESKDSRAEQREDMEDKELLPDISSGKFANKKYLKGSNIF